MEVLCGSISEFFKKWRVVAQRPIKQVSLFFSSQFYILVWGTRSAFMEFLFIVIFLLDIGDFGGGGEI